MKLVIEYYKPVTETVELPKKFERIWKLKEENWDDSDYDTAAAFHDWLQSLSDYGEVDVISKIE